MSSSPARSICFVGTDNYPVLNPEYGGDYIGGESVQQTLLAKAFAIAGFDVSMVVLDHGQPDAEVIDGVTVYKTYRPGSGLPVLRFIHPKATKLWNALKRADADIYYQSCAGAQTGIVAHFCRLHGKKMVFRIAHDTDCIPGEEIIPYTRDRKIYQYGLRRADLVVSQSVHQQELLTKNYSIESPVINMAVEQPVLKNRLEGIDVLWVNNIREFKRPERYLELARANPDLNFVMIGGPCTGFESLYDSINKGASEIDNLDYKGFVPYHEVNDYYHATRVFVNTSDTEGFPNSFLQSWVRGKPVISFFDPDSVIQRERLGTSPSNLEEMAGHIHQLLEDDNYYRELSANSHAFAEKYYSAGSVVEEYIRQFALAGIVDKAGDATGSVGPAVDRVAVDRK